MAVDQSQGIAASQLAEDDLMRELEHVHQTRHDTLLHGSGDALSRHTSRTQELEDEYLRRHPERDIHPERLRSGARALHGGVGRAQ